MSGITFLLLVFLSFFLNAYYYPDNQIEFLDSMAINNRNKELLAMARNNPNLTIYFAHLTLSESRKIQHLKGIADASLILGTAWLAKYNEKDSALYYNLQALNLYDSLKDARGMARASYGLAYVYSFKGKYPESEKYAYMSLKLFEQADDKRGMINTYNALSYLARQQKDIIKARNLTEEAIETALSVKDTLTLASALNDLGNIYKELALFNQAIDTYFEALKLWELKGNTSGISIAYGSIGLMYFYQKEWDKSLEYYRKKLPLSISEGDLWEVSKTYNSIAMIFNSQTWYDSALVYLQLGLEVNRQINLPSGIADSYHNIAKTLLLKLEIDSAYHYMNMAMAIAEDIDIVAIVNYHITLGHIQWARKEYKQALNHALTSYNMAKELHLPLVVYESAALLSDLYYVLKRKDLAYDYLKEYQQLSDSISNDEFLKRVTRMEIQHDFDKKQKEAEITRMEEKIMQANRIRQQKLYANGLLILLILLIVISLLFIRHDRLRVRYARMDLEQKLLRAQMNPHFIFNSLCAVQEFILAGKPQEANTFLAKIAKLMHNILENSREEFIPLEKEIETVKLYLDIQQLRFAIRFNYDIRLDESIEPENISIPPMLTQPCIENSIEHGFLNSREKGNLTIKYSLDNGLMKLEVTDNGIGRQKAEERKAVENKKKSISTMVTTERLENFRKKWKHKGIRYEIQDLYNEAIAIGTKVTIMLPYKKIYA
jgi:tetratricopeptide (TPR) repeat protein